eukprot:Gregarina_sp_Pseudo_9__2022@NODE_23_length_5717_cov_44_439591_g21_i0_p5_GENE_NODE_23_length_5717_cov_44_439591_g21_i0NODE_23_length_5717_cov_44_439591_g21_i0_p5_ORF_typecomplete_len181_score2_03zfDNL/PF05180_12/5_3e02zfDNL/PF05180_12/1_4e15Dynactin_p62/PF05502_13/0_074_NODE_23_length_5717_cov_44_439591_g21_i050075549
MLVPHGRSPFLWKAVRCNLIQRRFLALSPPERAHVIQEDRPISCFKSSYRPTLVSEDKVDRVPWLSMRHPEFQRSKEESCNPNHAIGDIRGVTQVSDRFLLMFTCNVCGKAMLREISKMAYYHGAVIVRCGCCKWLHLMSDATGFFRGADYPAVIEERIKSMEANAQSRNDLHKIEISNG